MLIGKGYTSQSSFISLLAPPSASQHCEPPPNPPHPLETPDQSKAQKHEQKLTKTDHVQQPQQTQHAKQEHQRLSQNAVALMPAQNPLSALTAQTTATAYSLQQLDKYQQAAVTELHCPVLVLAGPGAGKTRTLVERIRHLLANSFLPNEILAVTFTQRAAHELQERLCQQIGKASTQSITTCTLHSLAFQTLEQRGKTPPLLLDEEGAFRLFQKVANIPIATTKPLWSKLNLARETLTPLPFASHTAYTRYEQEKKIAHLIDYTDLLEFLLQQRQSNSSLPHWKAVLVDEIQDLSPLQLAIVASLVPADGTGFFGIGDPDQSIYGFRGAHGQVNTFFAQLWPHLSCKHLATNYRSAPSVVYASATSMHGHGTLQALTAHHKTLPGQVVLCAAPSAKSEARWVADKIFSLLGGSSHSLHGVGFTKSIDLLQTHTLSPADIAILVRTKNLMAPLQQALYAKGIRAAIPLVAQFWHDPNVIHVLNAIKKQYGMDVPTSPLPQDALPLLVQNPAHLPSVLKDSPPFTKQFWESHAFQELCASYTRHENWQNLLSWLSMQNELEAVQQKADCVQIMTIHAAKGLEFPSVFMPCLEEHIIPYTFPQNTRSEVKAEQINIDEERRLFYVGLTRAQQGLFLSYAKTRTLYGKQTNTEPSRFLATLPQDILTQVHLTMQTRKKAQQLSLLHAPSSQND